MKKAAVLFVLIFLAAFSGFSDEKEDFLKNAPFVGFAPLLVGGLNDGFGITLGYETAPLKQLSIVNSFTFLKYFVDMDNKNTSILTIGYTFCGRLYPLSSAVCKLFIGIGFNYTFAYGEVIDNDKHNGNIWRFVTEAGWKIILPKNFFFRIILWI